MKLKKISPFYICLIAFAIIVIILTQFGKAYLNGLLKDYEESQYKYVAEDFFKTNFSDGDTKTVTKLISENVSEYETEERISAYVQEITNNNKYTYQHSISGLSDFEKYTVMCGNLKIAEFNLVKSGEKTENNFDIYKVADFSVNSKLLNTYTIKIPAEYTLTVNGTSADEKYITSTEDIEITKSAITTGESVLIEYNVYTFENLCYQPLYEVMTPSGEICELYLEADNQGVVRAEYVFEESSTVLINEPEKTFDDDVAKAKGAEFAEKYTDYIIDATEAYACYMQKDASFSRVSKYLDPSSDLYYKLSTSPNWMVITHHSYAFEDAEVSEFYAYSDEIFSCRITITQVLKYSGLADYKDYIDITWFLKDAGNGKYLIFDSYTNMG